MYKIKTKNLIKHFLSRKLFQRTVPPTLAAEWQIVMSDPCAPGKPELSPNQFLLEARSLLNIYI